MGLSEIGEIFILLTGELIGDAAFFRTIFPGVRKESSKDKREMFLMPFFAIIAVIGTISIVLSIPYVLKIIAEFVSDYIKFSAPLVEGVKVGFVKFCKLGCFSKSTYVFCYMFFYMKLRKLLVDTARGIAKRILKKHDELFGIYVRDDFGTGYVLSEKGEGIYNNAYTIVLLDLLALAGFYFIWPENVKSILDVTWIDMLPIGILTCIMELTNYLSAGDRERWRWLFKRREKQAADCDLNIICLESSIGNYSLKKSMNVLYRRRCHIYDFRKKILEYINEGRDEEDARIQYLLDYVEKESAKRWVSLHSIEVAKRLVKGENLFVTNYFYQDLDVAVFFPIFMALLRDEKALVMVEDNGSLEEIVNWLREGIENIQDLTDFWTIDILQPMRDNIDVGVLAFQEICKEEQLQWCMDFLNYVSYVVVIEASGLLAGGQDILMSLASRIGRIETSCTWLLCDKNAEGMVDLYSHLLDKEFSYVSATPYFAKESLISYWNAEAERAGGWSNVQRYLGVEASIAEIAGTEHVGKIHWYGEDMMPVEDLRWVWGQYYESYQKQIGEEIPYQMLLEDNIHMEISGRGNFIREQQFIVTEDDCFNLFEKSRQYTTRAFDKICICVISPNYMLRNYMRANYTIMETDPKYISQFMPEHVNSRRNTALRLVRRMLEEAVSASEIVRMLLREEEMVNISNDKITKDLLESRIRLIFPGLQEIDIEATHRYCFSEEEREIQRENYFKIIDEEVKKQFRAYFSQAVYIDETGETRYISKMMLGGHLDQKYARGQFVVFNGKYYEIIGKTMSVGGCALQVKRASDQIQRRKYYRMMRRYRIDNLKNQDLEYLDQIKASAISHTVIYENQYYDIKREYICFEAETIGYVESADWGRIAGAQKVMLLQEEDVKGGSEPKKLQKNNNIRSYCDKQILKIVLKSQDKRAILLMAALTKEMFCTFYPQYFHLLDVAVNYKRYERDLNDELKVVISDISDGLEESENEFLEDCFFIIEDSREDMGLLRSIERNIEKILNIQKNYMIWSRENGENYIRYG